MGQHQVPRQTDADAKLVSAGIRLRRRPDQQDDGHFALPGEPGQPLAPFALVKIVIYEQHVARLMLEHETCLGKAIGLDGNPGVEGVPLEQLAQNKLFVSAGGDEHAATIAIMIHGTFARPRNRKRRERAA